MLLGGFKGWFDAPVFARFVSNAVRIGAGDVLTNDCRPDGLAGGVRRRASMRWGAPGSGLRGMIRWSASSVC
ncbi:MAG: hypothetical protein GDA36_09555 [Rhodobacteraceae bacterium]|nr:hypothetical protein [Paracoccaceae bacterium]